MTHSYIVLAELGFFLDGTFLSNNSIVLLSDIGVGSNALICLTDRIECCIDNGQGGWKFPDGKPIYRSTPKFNRSRGLSTNRLNRKIDAVGPWPTGIFTCKIPDQTENVIMDLYVGVYDDAGEGVLGMNCMFVVHESLYLHHQVHSLHHCPMIPHHIL